VQNHLTDPILASWACRRMRLRRRVFANPHPSTSSGCCVLGLCTSRNKFADKPCFWMAITL